MVRKHNQSTMEMNIAQDTYGCCEQRVTIGALATRRLCVGKAGAERQSLDNGEQELSSRQNV